MILLHIIKNVFKLKEYHNSFFKREMCYVCNFDNKNTKFICVVRHHDVGYPHIQIYKNKIDWFHYHTSVSLTDDYYFNYSDFYEYGICRLFCRCKPLTKEQCNLLHKALSEKSKMMRCNSCWEYALQTWFMCNYELSVYDLKEPYEMPNYRKLITHPPVDYWARLGGFLVKGWDA